MTCEDCIYYSDIALLACPYWICKNDDKPCEHFKDKNEDSEQENSWESVTK